MIDPALEGAFEKLSPLSSQTRSHYGNNQWTARSPKLGRELFLQSDLEYDHWIACVESDPSITHFCEHPLRVRVSVDGEDVTTMFDMIVRKGARDWEVREVKYVSQLHSNPRAIRQTKAQRTWCELHHAKYRVMTEEQIRHNPLWLNNWKLIIAYLNTANPETVNRYRGQVLQVLRANAPIPLNGLHKELSSLHHQLISTIVFDLIHKGECIAPLDTIPVNGRLFVAV